MLFVVTGCGTVYRHSQPRSAYALEPSTFCQCGFALVFRGRMRRKPLFAESPWPALELFVNDCTCPAVAVLPW